MPSDTRVRRNQLSRTLSEYRARHNEVMSERFGLNTWRDLRGSTAIFATIDDHEVTNDFAGGAPPSSNTADFDQNGAYINETDRYKAGLQAFQEYMPIEDRRYGKYRRSAHGTASQNCSGREPTAMPPR